MKVFILIATLLAVASAKPLEVNDLIDVSHIDMLNARLMQFKSDLNSFIEQVVSINGIPESATEEPVPYKAQTEEPVPYKRFNAFTEEVVPYEKAETMTDAPEPVPYKAQTEEPVPYKRFNAFTEEVVPYEKAESMTDAPEPSIQPAAQFQEAVPY